MNNNRKTIFFCTLLIMQWLKLVTPCPTYCACKWKNGKQTVECLNENLTYVPKGLDPGTQVLDLTMNNLHTLPKNCFENLSLINLQKIFLPYCHLSTINNDAFKSVSNLVELDLSHNILSNIPSHTFNDYPSLMRLCLNDNIIKIIKRYAFRPFRLLTTLELSNCEIEFIEEEAFVGLVSLEWLKLDGNKLANIKGTHIFPDSLHGIDLQNNMWKCDCNLQDLHSWILNFNVPNPMQAECVLPERLKGHYIKSIKENDLACLPAVNPSSIFLEFNENDNISLRCFVNATPQAHVTWWYQGQILLNNTITEPGHHIYFYKEEGTFMKKSELNILNVSTRDNGTFECIAANQAGKMQANFTINVILPEKVIIPPPINAIRHKSLIISLSIILTIIVFLVVILSILKCKNANGKRLRMNQNKGRDFQDNDNSSKTSTLNSFVSVIPPKTRENILSNQQINDSPLCSATASHQVSMINFDSTIYFSPSILNCNAENNPDLISDAEIMLRNCKYSNFCENSNKDVYQNCYPRRENHAFLLVNKSNVSNIRWKEQQTYLNTMATLPRRYSNNERKISGNVFNSTLTGCDEYPTDYGLPIPLVQQHTAMVPTVIPNAASASMYGTLPLKRMKTRCEWSDQGPLNQSTRDPNIVISKPLNLAANSQTNAFAYFVSNQNTNQSNNLQSNNGTYPITEEFIPSPPEGYKSDFDNTVPQTIKNNLNSNNYLPSENKRYPTKNLSHNETNLSNKNENQFRSLIKNNNDKSNDSPDEGYVGENTDTTAI